MPPWDKDHWETTTEWKDLIWQLRLDYETYGMSEKFKKELEKFFDITVRIK